MINRIKKYLTSHGGILYDVALRIKERSLLRFKVKTIIGKKNQFLFQKSLFIIGSELTINGNNNYIEVGKNSLVLKTKFFIKGSENKIIIQENVRLRGASIWIEDNNCQIIIGKNSSIGNAHLAVTEDNSKITIGENCMFASDIDIRTGDSHSIIDDLTKYRINNPDDVIVGNHVWIGSHVSILKGSTILDNSVVGTRSVVTKKFNQQGLLIAGIPAKIIKENINWLKERI